MANELVFPSWDISWELTNIHLANGIYQCNSNSGNIHPLGWDSRSSVIIQVVMIASWLGDPRSNYSISVVQKNQGAYGIDIGIKTYTV